MSSVRFARPLRARALAAAAVAALVALAACGGDSATGPGGRVPADAYVPASIAGDWKWGTISMLSFWDDHTGDYVGTASGVAVFFRFEPDGRYTQYVYVLARTYGCVTQTWTEIRGSVKFGDDSFDARATSGTYKSSDSCIARNNFQRAMTASEVAGQSRTYLWKWETDEYGKTWFRVGHDAQTWSSFERE